MIAFQVSLNFDPAKEPMKLRDYSEEHTSYNEGFRSTILQSFQFEPGQKKKSMFMRAMRKKLQKQSCADILQNRCS